jgi:preprotein translocase subunit SecD
MPLVGWRQTAAVTVVLGLAVLAGCGSTSRPRPQQATHTLVIRKVDTDRDVDCPADMPTDAASPSAVADPRGGGCLSLSPVLLSLQRPTSVQATPPQFAGRPWSVNVQLNDDDAGQFGRLAGENWHAVFALILDGKVLSMPTIEPDLVENFDGKIEIVGKSQQDAVAAAASIGALPR